MFRRFQAYLRRMVRQRVTYGGALFTLAMVLVGVAAAASANNLLFLIVAAMLSTLMVSGFVSRLSLAGLELDFVLPEHIAAGRKLAGRIYVRNAKSWVPSFSVHLGGSNENLLTTLYFPAIPGGAVLDETVEVCFRRRGVYRESGFQFSTSFPFGFIERRADVTLRRDVLVYPPIDPQPGFEEMLAAVRGDLEAQAQGRGRDFYRIRPYEALETARHVDWKASAHTGELQVREFAREQERLLEVFLDLDVAPANAAWFELAVEACAFLVWRVSERGGRLRFRTQEFDASIPESGDVYTVLRYLATVGALPGKPPLAPGNEESYQLVFTTANPQAMAESGWGLGRVVGPGVLARGGMAAERRA
ncbi:MAG TPA: DUF58 domain-containing protein [Bryobacteraceae bacterium]|nr:DUF58 domain-containing protein [Bryobacteraceae bacterium]